MSFSKIVRRIVGISFTALVFILIVYGLYQLGLNSYLYGYRIFTEPAVTTEAGSDRLVQIKSSMSALDVGEILEKKGLIRDKWLFMLQMKFSEYNNQLVTGYYTLDTSMTAHEMLEIMCRANLQEEESDK